MIFSRLSSIPAFFPDELKRSLYIEKMGIRFVDEKLFRNSGLESLKKNFSSYSKEEQQISIACLREALRSACVLTTLIPKMEQNIPTFSVSSKNSSDLISLITEASKQNLALPVLICEKNYESLLHLYTAVLTTHYRGPVFVAAKNDIVHQDALHSEFQELGILNSVPEKTHSLNDKNTNQCVEILKNLLWFRNVILPLSEPWMKLGYPKKI